MPTKRRQDDKPRCFLAIPFANHANLVREAATRGAQSAGFQVASLFDAPVSADPIQELLVDEIGRADVVIADISAGNPNVFFEAGMALAIGKGLFLLADKESAHSIPFDLRSFQLVPYENTDAGLTDLVARLQRALQLYRKSPRQRRPSLQSRYLPFSIDWGRLDKPEIENLCFELLTHMGYRRLAWGKELREIDLVAETRKKDPDGFEYQELWLVAMGRNTSTYDLLEMARHDPEYLLHRLFRNEDRIDRVISNKATPSTMTLLIILTGEDIATDEIERLKQLSSPHLRMSRSPYSFRLRVWDQTHLTSLVQQFPQIGFKYFTEEGRSQSKYRKTPEELYLENSELNNRLLKTLSAYEEEKNRRIRAERDAIWKDISFSAAHKIGNPLFAIETNLDPLQKRIMIGDSEDALLVISEIRASVEKAKGFVEQFKSLARSQEITPIPIPLKPLLIDACMVARNKGIDCSISCDDRLRVVGDHDRLAECFDELVANAICWFDKEEKSLTFVVTDAQQKSLPQAVDTSRTYIVVTVTDNGPGVPLDKKDAIFNAFVTTRDHGTGLGLALVRRIIEGHGGSISEIGLPGQGAVFEIFLPSAIGE